MITATFFNIGICSVHGPMTALTDILFELKSKETKQVIPASPSPLLCSSQSSAVALPPPRQGPRPDRVPLSLSRL